MTGDGRLVGLVFRSRFVGLKFAHLQSGGRGLSPPVAQFHKSAVNSFEKVVDSLMLLHRFQPFGVVVAHSTPLDHLFLELLKPRTNSQSMRLDVAARLLLFHGQVIPLGVLVLTLVELLAH